MNVRSGPGLKPLLGFMSVIFVTHLFLLAMYLGGFRKLVSDQPLIYEDHGFHLYYSMVGSRNLKELGTTAGYDPYLMAGAPTDFIDSSERLHKVLMLFFQRFGYAAGYKLEIYLMGIAIPWLLFLTGCCLKRNSLEILIAVTLGTVFWWIDGGSDMFHLGMVGFQLACFFGIGCGALFYYYLKTFSRRAYFFLFPSMALVLLIHPGSLPLIVIPCGVLYLLNFRKLSPIKHLSILAIMAFAILCNLFWIIPFLINLPFGLSAASSFTKISELFGYVIYAISQNYLALLPSLSVLIFIIAGISGLKKLRKEGNSDLAVMLVTCILFFLVIFTSGGSIPIIKNSQPVRYALAWVLFLIFPASIGLAGWLARIRRFQSPKMMAAMASLLYGGSLALTVFFWLAVFSPENSNYIGLNSKVSSIRDWISSNTDRQARVLVEDWGAISFGGSQASSLLAYYTNRELIGGPHWTSYLKYHFADFSQNKLFGHSLNQLDEKSLAVYMTLYNIGWVAAFLPDSKKVFDAHPGLFQPLSEAGGYKFYLVRRPKNFFLEGTGRLQADYNKIILKNVRTPTGRVVIAYHWHPKLETSRPAQIVRVMIGDDPVGFIGIIDPLPEMIIRINYWR